MPSVKGAEDVVTEVARTGRPTSAGGLPSGGYNEFRAGFPGGSDFVGDGRGFSAETADTYRRIRASPDDTQLVSANTGIHRDVIEGMRQNLFVQQHDVAVGPGQVERGYFTPQDRIANLWDGAADGTLDPAQRREFRSLAAHEYVENKLMEAGIPFRSAEAEAFDADGNPRFNPDHPGCS